MKILLQNTLFYPAIGGIENYLYNASKSLIEIGNEPAILCSKHLETLPRYDKYENIKVIRYPQFNLPKPFSILNQINYEHKLRNFINKNLKNYDIVLSRHPYCAYASCKALPNIPHIYIQASVWPYITRLAYIKRDPLRDHIFDFQNYIDQKIEHEAMCECSKIVTLSYSRMNEIRDYYKFPSKKFIVIPAGIDLIKFRPRSKDRKLLEKLNIPYESKIILTVCRLSPEKNLKDLVNAFKKTEIEDCYLLIIGDGPDRKILEFLIKELKLVGRVRLLGFRTDVERFYSLADVFVLTSKYEGFGHVFLEAMASGVPCIGYRSDYPNVIVASEEIIQDKETGYCVDPYSTDELSDKISRIISDENISEKMKVKARKICEDKYSWNLHIKKLMSII